jgi:hypothetical protein
MTSRGHTHELDANRAPLDHVTQPPNVVNVGPQLFHKPYPQFEDDNDGELPIPPADGGSHDPRVGGASHSQTTPLEQMTMPPQLANTLEHIVGQLDILTQVRSYLYVCMTWKMVCSNVLQYCGVFMVLVYQYSASNLYRLISNVRSRLVVMHCMIVKIWHFSDCVDSWGAFDNDWE